MTGIVCLSIDLLALLRYRDKPGSWACLISKVRHAVLIIVWGSPKGGEGNRNERLSNSLKGGNIVGLRCLSGLSLGLEAPVQETGEGKDQTARSSLGDPGFSNANLYKLEFIVSSKEKVDSMFLNLREEENNESLSVVLGVGVLRCRYPGESSLNRSFGEILPSEADNDINF